MKKDGRPITERPGTEAEAPRYPGRSDGRAIESFLETVRETVPRADHGHVIFALDATMSRQQTWDMAAERQAEMFDEVARAGGLAVSLVYFRGLAECRASRWVTDARSLKSLMSRIECGAGRTQIGRVLAHSIEEARARKVAALVHVGDAMEEPIDDLAAMAGELGLLGVKAFMFHEGRDPTAAAGFKEIARLTDGAYVRFDEGAAGRLGALLRAVAAYASGGMAGLQALSARGGEGARLLISIMRGA